MGPWKCWQCGEEYKYESLPEVCGGCGEDTSTVLFCWCCGEHEAVAVVESVDDDSSRIRMGVCQQCLSDHCSEYHVVESI